MCFFHYHWANKFYTLSKKTFLLKPNVIQLTRILNMVDKVDVATHEIVCIMLTPWCFMDVGCSGSYGV